MSIEYDSAEELYFSWYLDELLAAGYIKSWKYQPKPFIITKPVKCYYSKQLKTKSKIVEATLFQGYSYTADFLITWLTRSEHIFYQVIFNNGAISSKPGDVPFIAQVGENTGNIISVVDVKGTYNQNDAYSRFSKDQKLVWDKYKIYVQKIITAPAVSKKGVVKPKDALFTTTFMPNNYRFTPTGKLRLIRFPHKTLEEFVRTKEIEFVK
jgi:hypothetical protein